MKNRIKKKRLYACRATAHSISHLLARFDPKRHGGEVWSQMTPVGQEFGASKAAADCDG
ncbi:MAG TPA: hypothetical protein VJ654_10730 [Noviherbaspirillum sp.]|nr:hypothetical protein [Noviherbaspirillum sp.]